VSPAVAILFAQTGFPAQNVCAPPATMPTPGSNGLIDLEVATAQWATYPGALTDSLAPGTYTISNEQDSQETLCKLRGGGTAYLQVEQWGGQSNGVAISGTVTLDSISASSVTGHFDVMVGGPSGETNSPTALSGAFNASPCP
jgi:hypothetical protein